MNILMLFNRLIHLHACVKKERNIWTILKYMQSSLHTWVIITLQWSKCHHEFSVFKKSLMGYDLHPSTIKKNKTETHWPFEQAMEWKKLWLYFCLPILPPVLFYLFKEINLKSFDLLVSYNFLHLIFHQFFYCHGNYMGQTAGSH